MRKLFYWLRGKIFGGKYPTKEATTPASCEEWDRRIVILEFPEEPIKVTGMHPPKLFDDDIPKTEAERKAMLDLYGKAGAFRVDNPFGTKYFIGTDPINEEE